MDPNNPESSVCARFTDLAGKVAIVTGASRGLGVGIARFLGRQGMKLVLAARSRQAGEDVAGQLDAEGIECAWITADVAAADDVKRVFDNALQRYGAVDVLVNNAAQLRSKPFPKLDEESYYDSFERNVRIVYEMSRPVVAHMIERKTGAIVNISSVGGLRAHRGLAGYDASKGAIDSLTRVMALDLAPYGIRVNSVAPGRMGNGSEKVANFIPLGRAGTSDEAAAAVAFLVSDAAAYVTGQILYVDGGLTVQLSPPGTFI